MAKTLIVILTPISAHGVEKIKAQRSGLSTKTQIIHVKITDNALLKLNCYLKYTLF